ncbi:hypothetical protein HYH03_004443 [Edaphochlamys debaryana]|uniref:Guanylate cyclase domain-containing protein n=1 Tax=Edaphochlamys debaryana TaxID=47281 RepID=A0A835YBC6_9CHLO|nr:hypothetical protein HYH03_004443 [Edaphochlamys debaryana]|eukprot:KAG2497706.1 hypothetical protein HYH03_004443 [Edaphochlamys debaryana]
MSTTELPGCRPTSGWPPRRVALAAAFYACSLEQDNSTAARFLLAPANAASVLRAAADELLTAALGEGALPRAASDGDASGDGSGGWLDWGLLESWEAWEDELMSLPAAGGLQLSAGGGAGGGEGGALSRTAAFLAPHSLAAPMLRRGALVDASGLAALDPALQHWGVHPTLAQMSITGGKTLGVPLDGSQLLLFLRADVFSAAGLPPPASWQELLQMAERLNGTSMPALGAGAAGAPDQGPLFGFCLPPPRLLGSLALAVLAPMVQTNGTGEGMYLDPSSLRPAAATLAMSYALSYLRRLAALSPPSTSSATSTSPPYSEDFAQGRCAMTVGSAAQFRRNSHTDHPAGPSAVRGQVLASLLPGSELVLSEGQSSAGDSLVACTPGICPDALATEASAKGGPGNATAGTSGLRRSLRRRLQQGAQALVNRAPLLSPDGLVGAIAAGGEVTAQLLSWSLLSSVGGPRTSWELLLPPGSEVGPWRQEHFQDAQRWAAAGYDAADTASFLRAAQGSLDHPNVVWPLRVKGAVTHNRAVSTAAAAVVALATAPSPPSGGGAGAGEVTAGDPRVAAAVGALAEAVTALFGAGQPDPALRAAYLDSLPGYRTGSVIGGTTVSSKTSAGSSRSGVNVGLIVGLVVGCTVAVVAGALALGYCVRGRGRGAGASYWALVEAPPPGPATCIAVTDIEGSTSLWEALPEAVLDRALRTHHRVVRTTSSLYRGYESATEGDSFILAFATPAAAASFAVALQPALLEAEWPAELLAAPSCRPVFVTRREEVERAESVSLTPPPAAKPHKQQTIPSLLPGSGGVMSPRGGFGSPNAAGQHHSVWHGYRAAVMALTGNRAAPKPALQQPVAAGGAARVMQSAALPAERASNPAHSGRGSAAARSTFGAGLLASRLLASRSNAGKRMPSAPQVAITGLELTPGPLAQLAKGGFSTVGPSSVRSSQGNRVAAARAPAAAGSMSQGHPLLESPWQRVFGARAPVVPGARPASHGRPPASLGHALGVVEEDCKDATEEAAAESGASAEDDSEDEEAEDAPAASELLMQLMLVARQKRNLHASELTPVVENDGSRVGSHAPTDALDSQPTPGSLLAYIHRLFSTSSSAHPVSASQTEVVALVFAGLRVRVGLHCGVQAHEIVYNPASARQTFGGEALRIAKGVTDCASGGQVVLSGEVLAQVQLAGDLSDLPGVMMDLGDHQLFESVPHGPVLLPAAVMGPEALPLPAAAPAPAAPSTQLLQLVSAPLLGRLALMPPFRPAIHQYTPGFMDAPVGESMAVVVFRVAHASALLAWDAAVAAESLALLELFLRASLGRLLPSASASHGPCYLAAAPPGCPLGTFVAVFANPAAAGKWALEASSQLEGLPWPQGLLESRFGAPLEGLSRAEAEAQDAAVAPRHGPRRGLGRALSKAAAPHHVATHSALNSLRLQQHSPQAGTVQQPSTPQTGVIADDPLAMGTDLMELFSGPSGAGNTPAQTLSSMFAGEDSVTGPPTGTGQHVGMPSCRGDTLSSVSKRSGSGLGHCSSLNGPAGALPGGATLSRLLESTMSLDHDPSASSPGESPGAGETLPIQAPAVDIPLVRREGKSTPQALRPGSGRTRFQDVAYGEVAPADKGVGYADSAPSRAQGPGPRQVQPRRSHVNMLSMSTARPTSATGMWSGGGGGFSPLAAGSPAHASTGRGAAPQLPRSISYKKGLGTRILLSLHGSFSTSRISRNGSGHGMLPSAGGGGAGSAAHFLLGGGTPVSPTASGAGALGTGASMSPRTLASALPRALAAGATSSLRDALTARGPSVLRRKPSDVGRSTPRQPESPAALAAAAALAAEDAEVVTLRGLRVRAGLAVGAVRVELCPMTGRVVYSGKPVTAAMTAAAAARLGTLYATQGAATAVAAREAAVPYGGFRATGMPASMSTKTTESGPSLVDLPRLVSTPATSRVTAEAGSTGGGAHVWLKRKEAFVRFRLVSDGEGTDGEAPA